LLGCGAEEEAKGHADNACNSASDLPVL
jgi:hypothetical protein